MWHQIVKHPRLRIRLYEYSFFRVHPDQDHNIDQYPNDRLGLQQCHRSLAIIIAKSFQLNLRHLENDNSYLRSQLALQDLRLDIKQWIFLLYYVQRLQIIFACLNTQSMLVNYFVQIITYCSMHIDCQPPFECDYVILPPSMNPCPSRRNLEIQAILALRPSPMWP